MSSSFEMHGRPSGRANSRGGRGRGRGNPPRASGSQYGRPAEPQVAYGRDPTDDDGQLGQQGGGFPPPTNFSAPRSSHQSSSSSRGNLGSRRGKMATFHNRPPLHISGQRADENGEMNAHLSERIISSKRPQDKATTVSYSGVPRNPLVEKYERALPFSADGSAPSAWRALPDVPSTAELMTVEVDLPVNVVDQPWDSVDEYLGAHYELLREDSFSPLRDAVGRFRMEPSMDDQYDICVYENCRIVGVTFAATFGICVKVSFSTNRARKKIRWENSKRLCPGTLVALTTDDFTHVVRIATVAARPISGLEGKLPYGTVVDLLLHPDELELDPTKSWIMIEARSGYFEAFKHTLRALQRMDVNFPLNKVLTLQNTRVGNPQFLTEKPELSLVPCFNDHPDISTIQNVNVLQNFPRKEEVTTSMDEVQLEAVERILTKELAIVQGPPGCGKTFVSTKSLAAMIANSKHNDPPIIVACQTNHALDQLLRSVIAFEKKVIRLGGRTQDTGVIRERTLFNIRKSKENFEVQGSGYLKCRSKFRRLEHKGQELLERLSERNLTPDNLLLHGVITQAQRDSFHKYTEQWVKLSVGNKENAISPMIAWIGDALQPIIRREDMAFEFEDEDIGVEELKDLEAEFDDEWDGELRGIFVEFNRLKRAITRPGVTEETIQHWIKKDNVWEIPEPLRGDIYARFERLYTAAIEEEMRKLSREYAANVAEFKIARWEKDAHILQDAKVIGLTTTGVSKYRSLVAALEPKICLIEEAAETLEGPLIAACYPSIQQLVLVGDHKQLKGHCNVSELEKPPYNLSISMFERLVSNDVKYTMLTKQRRMRPEIRQILMPIYPKLGDDHQVLNMQPVPGMGNTNLYFLAHQIPEEQDELSKKNPHEAQMIVGLCNYLVENGTQQKEITILTFYTGQARELRKLLGRTQRLNKDPKDRIRVATVDSFQGEENEVVILSLCRSNAQGNIGFLNVPNRVCVSLSRAKRGFYMFGNANLLSQVSGLWWDILQILNARTPSAISTAIPVTCQKHKRVVEMEFASDWLEINGGCKTPCGEYLDCGHKCTLLCHPYEHNLVRCAEPCRIIFPCGHPCRKKCFEECGRCSLCVRQPDLVHYSSYNPNSHMDRLSDRLAGVQTTDSNQLARGPPPTHYQSRESNRPMERPSEPFLVQTANVDQLTRGPTLADYQGQDHSMRMAKPSEPFPVQTVKSNQLVRGAPPPHYQANKPMERPAEPFPIQTTNSNQVVRGPPPTHYQSHNATTHMGKPTEAFPAIRAANNMVRGPLPNYHQNRSSKHMEKISERLAEVKTTDMIPTMLNPVSPRKKSSASETSIRGPVAPLISWDNTPSQQDAPTSPPNFPVVGWDANAIQPTVQSTVLKPQKEIISAPLISSKVVPTQQTPRKKKEKDTSLVSLGINVVHSPTPKKTRNTPPIVSLDDKTVQAIISQEKNEKEAKRPVSVDTKTTIAPTGKVVPTKDSPSPAPRYESPVDYDMDKFKELLQQQSLKKEGIVNGNVNGADKNPPKHVSGNKANGSASTSGTGTADAILISFDDEPVTKTLASAISFDDNKVLMPTMKPSRAVIDEKKNGSAMAEKKAGFPKEIDLLGDF